MHEMGEIKIAQELRVDEVSVQTLREDHETIQQLISKLQQMQEQKILWVILEIFKKWNQITVECCLTFPINLQWFQVLVPCWTATNACLLTHMEYIWITGKIFGNRYSRFSHTEIIIKEFNLTMYKENLEQSHKLQGEGIFSQEMTNKIEAQFQCQHLQEGRRLWVLQNWSNFRWNSMFEQQRQQISEMQFDKVLIRNLFSVENSTCSDYPSEAMLWIKEVEMVDSLDELRSSRSASGK